MKYKTEEREESFMVIIRNPPALLCIKGVRDQME